MAKAPTAVLTWLIVPPLWFTTPLAVEPAALAEPTKNALQVNVAVF
jgi:hypothetical protein